jgi:hypothetical protein
MLAGLLYKGKEKRGEKQGGLAEKSPIFHAGRSFEKASHWQKTIPEGNPD